MGDTVLTDSAPATTGRIAAALAGVSGFPRAMPGLPVTLDPRQEIACAARVLDRAGFALDVAGHITVMQDGGELMWATPYGRWWYEMSASDICVADSDGDLVEGPWDLTPAIAIHTELHRVRPDARVIVHNHPPYATLLATLHRLPRIVDQQACLLDGEMVLVNEYTGGVDNPKAGQELAAAVGQATVAVLANHGVLVIGSSLVEATYKAVVLERTCLLDYQAMAAGASPHEVPTHFRGELKAMLARFSSDYYWRGAVRRLLRDEPDVLD